MHPSLSKEFYLLDVLGSTCMLTSSAAASTFTYNFKAFGEHYSFC